MLKTKTPLDHVPTHMHLSQHRQWAVQKVPSPGIRRLFRGAVYCIIVLITVQFFPDMHAQSGVFSKLSRSSEAQYLVRLSNGEQLIGGLVDILDETPQGKAIKLKTAIGVATIYESQVLEIQDIDAAYRHAHRVFMLPTAEPIGDNHYIGSVELLGLWAGFGIGDIGSIIVARTFVPSIDSREQVSLINLKATVYEEKYTTMTGKINFAVGANLTWFNSANRISNVYVSSTFTRIRSRISAIVFANISGDHSDLFTATAGTIGNVVIRYPAGSIGFGIGVDTRFPGRQDLHFIGELWNSNISSANNSALMLGLRLANSSIAMDFGFVVITTPSVIPVTSFSWTPF